MLDTHCTVRYKKQFWSQISVMYKLCGRWNGRAARAKAGRSTINAFGTHPSNTQTQSHSKSTHSSLLCLLRLTKCLCQSVLPVPLIWLCTFSTSIPLLSFFRHLRNQMLDCKVIHLLKYTDLY